MWGSQERSYFNEYWSGQTSNENRFGKQYWTTHFGNSIVTLKSEWIISNNVDIYVHLHLKCWFISGFRRFCNRSTIILVGPFANIMSQLKLALNSKLCQPGGPTIIHRHSIKNLRVPMPPPKKSRLKNYQGTVNKHEPSLIPWHKALFLGGGWQLDGHP